MDSRGLAVSRRFYTTVVSPVLGARDIPHSAALLGPGSEVLGFDDETSTDHDFSARVLLFAPPNEHADIIAALDAAAPDRFEGLAVAPPEQMVTTVDAFCLERLGFRPAGGISLRDWLTTPQQRLLEVVRGAVFHDGLGQLRPLRSALAFYPRDIWLYAMACQWLRIAQEEHLMGRTVMVGDSRGRHLLAARLAADAMRLAFLMARQYAPYPKWFGSAFETLDAARPLGPLLDRFLAAPAEETMDAWVAVGVALVQLHNALGATPPLEAAGRPFHTRPFHVIAGERVHEALWSMITAPAVRDLPPIGCVDQWSDSTDVIERAQLTKAAGALYP